MFGIKDAQRYKQLFWEWKKVNQQKLTRCDKLLSNTSAGTSHFLNIHFWTQSRGVLSHGHVLETRTGVMFLRGRRSLMYGLRSKIKQMEGAHSFELGLVFPFGSGSLLKYTPSLSSFQFAERAGEQKKKKK